jgi:hypothetical protein
VSYYVLEIIMIPYVISKIAVMFYTGMKVVPCCGQAGIMYDSATEMIHCEVIPLCGVGYNPGLSQ